MKLLVARSHCVDRLNLGHVERREAGDIPLDPRNGIRGGHFRIDLDQTQAAAVFGGKTVRAANHCAHGVNLSLDGNPVRPLPHIRCESAIGAEHALTEVKVVYVQSPASSGSWQSPVGRALCVINPQCY